MLPPAPSKPSGGVGFRDYSECLEHIRSSSIEAPEGGLAVPLGYTVHEQPSYSIVLAQRTVGGTRCARPRQMRCARKSRTTNDDVFISAGDA